MPSERIIEVQPCPVCGQYATKQDMLGGLLDRLPTLARLLGRQVRPVKRCRLCLAPLPDKNRS